MLFWLSVRLTEIANYKKIYITSFSSLHRIRLHYIEMKKDYPFFI